MTASSAQTAPPAPDAPTLLNGATVHGWYGLRGLRHPTEMPLVYLSTVVTVLAYGAWILMLVTGQLDAAVSGSETASSPSLLDAAVYSFFLTGLGGQLLILLPVLPIILWVVRALQYAQMRSQGVQMSPTQFPEGYRMVAEAAAAFGMRRVPDAYVVLGNGQINAFAAGHGFRRFVVVYSDLFEVGGRARDPEALRFVISHEVGHLAAGHVSYLRLLCTQLIAQVPLLGPALSRAQEYTADNHGYALAPGGVSGVMGLLGAGKYLGAQVNLHALADRAAREKGLWLHLAVWSMSHPPLTWRAAALRDRRRPGRIMLRPPEAAAWYPPFQPTGSQPSSTWPTPAQALAALDAITPPAGTEEQFGRYPGVRYDVPADTLRLACPAPQMSPAPPAPADPGAPTASAAPSPRSAPAAQAPDPAHAPAPTQPTQPTQTTRDAGYPGSTSR